MCIFLENGDFQRVATSICEALLSIASMLPRLFPMDAVLERLEFCRASAALVCLGGEIGAVPDQTLYQHRAPTVVRHPARA